MRGKSGKIRLAATTVVLIMASGTFAGRTIYVDDDASGANDGSSWGDAYQYLQDALADANSAAKPVEIRVAQGIHKPDQGASHTPADREATFELVNGVTLKGGYAGFGAPDPNHRDVDVYETILSGDLAGDDAFVSDLRALLTEFTRAENSYHVVTACGTDATTVLDGFVITAGNANEAHPSRHTSGGGMNNTCESNLSVINCTFTTNSATWGGGLQNDCGSPTLTNCIFSQNSAKGTGGGVENGNGNPILTNCTFSSNWACRGGGMYSFCHSDPTLIDCSFISNLAEHFGGGMYNKGGTGQSFIRCIFENNHAVWFGGGLYNTFSSVPFIGNCLFANNSSDHWGGAIHFFDSNAEVTNCTIVNNSAEKGAAVGYGYPDENKPSKVKIGNCILWGNGHEIWNYDNSLITVTYSDVEHTGRWPWPGLGNINAAPCFADPGNGDYHLESQAGRWDPETQSWVKDDVTSPCIDAGDPSSPIGHEPFPNGGIINIGAYGGTAEASKSYFGGPVCETIVAGDINGDCKVDFQDFRILALHWLQDKSP